MSYFVTLLPFNIISVVDQLAPSCYLVELFSRLIATLQVVLFAPLRFKIKLLWMKIAVLRYSIKIGLSLIARLRVVLVPGQIQKILATFRIVLQRDQNYSSIRVESNFVLAGFKIVFPLEPK